MNTPKNSPSIGDRMKDYENVTRTHLYRRTPVIIRLDGKAFHTFTRGMQKPYDEAMVEVMAKTAQFLLDEIQGAEIAYTQSDEISLFLRDYTRFESESWFDNNIQKMVSVAASMATGIFNKEWRTQLAEFMARPSTLAFFDARVFNLPKGGSYQLFDLEAAGCDSE
jgi:tRNA(His) guanylyltransferase